MARPKKKLSAVVRSHNLNEAVNHQIKILLSLLLFLFLLASVFNKAGALGQVVYLGMNRIMGGATFLISLLLIWLTIRLLFPDKLKPRFMTVLGAILFTLSLTGIMHSFVEGDSLAVAGEGLGGGLVGYMVVNATSTTLGLIVGRLLLFFMLFISLMLILDRAILPFLHPEKDENQDLSDSRVRVVGEIKPSPLDRLRQRFIKPETIAQPIRKNRVDGVQPLLRAANWNYPPISLLDIIDMKPQAGNIQKRMEVIQKTLRDFGIEVTMTDVNVGPTVTQYTLRPAEGVKLNAITARQDDLALALAAQSLRVEAPIPGKGLVGIEIPNDKKALVGLRDILEAKSFKQVGSKLAIALGRDAAGDPAVADLEKMPHSLLAGATGSGKSVCINSIIITLLMNNSPDEVRLILIDPKRVELTGYNGIPHLLTPVVTDAKDTIAALGWCVREMERRYKLFQMHGKRNIEQYNEQPELSEGKLPYIVIIIDELADLMIAAAREVESSIVRLAQMARAVGLHLIVATQRPSVDVITGLIKANIPTRLAFAVASQVDSRTILDMAGAEKLLGYGDMLYVSTDIGKPKRIQGAFASEREIQAVIAYIKMQEIGDRYNPSVLETREENRLGGRRDGRDFHDELAGQAYEVVQQAGKASSTLLQTRLSVGYARAARLMQDMEDKGLIGPAKGSKPREVYGATINRDDEEEQGIAAYPENE